MIESEGNRRRNRRRRRRRRKRRKRSREGHSSDSKQLTSEICSWWRSDAELYKATHTIKLPWRGPRVH